MKRGFHPLWVLTFGRPIVRWESNTNHPGIATVAKSAPNSLTSIGHDIVTPMRLFNYLGSNAYWVLGAGLGY